MSTNLLWHRFSRLRYSLFGWTVPLSFVVVRVVSVCSVVGSLKVTRKRSDSNLYVDVFLFLPLTQVPEPRLPLFLSSKPFSRRRQKFCRTRKRDMGSLIPWLSLREEEGNDPQVIRSCRRCQETLIGPRIHLCSSSFQRDIRVVFMKETEVARECH